MKDKSPILMTATGKFGSDLIQNDKSHYRYKWIWVKSTKTGHLNSGYAPMLIHEEVLLFSRKRPIFYAQMTEGHPEVVVLASHKRACDSGKPSNWGKADDYNDYCSSRRFPTSVIFFPTDKQHHHFHPTQKPLALCEYFLLTYTLEGDLVFDPTMGSGSMAVACAKLGRRFMGVEMDPTIYQVAKQRIRYALVHGEDMPPALLKSPRRP